MELNTFLYFAYGSNLLTKRIHINNPSAVRKGIGKLKGYRLDFGDWSDHWKGSVATIVPDQSTYVWGAIWEMNMQDMPNLDRQEGVGNKQYKVVTVNVITPENYSAICRCYQLCQQPFKIQDSEVLPENRKPSLLYMTVIINGAKESCLPESYINDLKKIQHNGWTDTEKNII
ncbi:hypothetical protein PGB90_003033 [Kerria lacca]